MSFVCHYCKRPTKGETVINGVRIVHVCGQFACKRLAVWQRRAVRDAEELIAKTKPMTVGERMAWLPPGIYFMPCVVLAFLLAATLHAQPCVVSPTTLTQLPTGTGTTPAAHDLIVAGSNLYGDSQWGVFRAQITNPAHPSAMQLFGVGIQAGFPGGVIPINCDCFAAWRAFDVVNTPQGDRIIGSWSPFSQGGGPPPGPVFSGLAGQILSGTTLAMAFGQQLSLPGLPRTGGRIAALAVGGHFYGYFPVEGSGVYSADITSPTGNAAWQNGIASVASVNWGGPAGSASPRLRAANGLLVGSTPDLRIHVATVDGNGTATERASTPDAADPVNLDIGVINGRTFVFSAEDLSGLRVYEYTANPPTLALAGSIAGRFKLVRFHSGVLFGHRLDPSGKSFIDIYNTAWLVGAVQVLAASLPTLGAGTPTFLAYGFDAVVDAQNAYVYREAVSTPEQSLAETTVSLGCLAGGGTTPTPTPSGQTPTPQVTPTPTPGGHIFQDWIYQVVAEKLMSACGPAVFCPGDAATTTHQGIVSRGQMSAFLLKSEHGASYLPPPCTPPGSFTDVPCAH